MSWRYTNRPRGRNVLLIGGSVPHVWEKDDPSSAEDELDVRVEEAVMALARAVFIRGGQLAFLHNELLTPLLLEIFRDYWAQPGAENLESREPADSRTAPLLILSEDEHRAELSGYSYVVGRYAAMEDASQVYDREFFRAVCIGGDHRAQRIGENVKAERLVAIPSTGGAAIELTRRDWQNPEASMFETIEGMQNEMKFSPLEDQAQSESGIEPWPDFRYAVYPLLMAQILDSQPIPSLG
jgi:hypothetical protein